MQDCQGSKVTESKLWASELTVQLFRYTDVFFSNHTLIIKGWRGSKESFLQNTSSVLLIILSNIQSFSSAIMPKNLD